VPASNSAGALAAASRGDSPAASRIVSFACRRAELGLRGRKILRAQFQPRDQMVLQARAA